MSDPTLRRSLINPTTSAVTLTHLELLAASEDTNVPPGWVDQAVSDCSDLPGDVPTLRIYAESVEHAHALVAAWCRAAKHPAWQVQALLDDSHVSEWVPFSGCPTGVLVCYGSLAVDGDASHRLDDQEKWSKQK